MLWLSDNGFIWPWDRDFHHPFTEHEHLAVCKKKNKQASPDLGSDDSYLLPLPESHNEDPDSRVFTHITHTNYSLHCCSDPNRVVSSPGKLPPCFFFFDNQNHTNPCGTRRVQAISHAALDLLHVPTISSQSLLRRRILYNTIAPYYTRVPLIGREDIFLLIRHLHRISIELGFILRSSSHFFNLIVR